MKVGYFEMTPVVSKRLVAIGYDEQSSTLAIQFPKNRNQIGGIYIYFNFPRKEFDTFMAAPSKGSYFEQTIRKAPYTFRRIAHVVVTDGADAVVWIKNDCPNCGDPHLGDERCK